MLIKHFNKENSKNIRKFQANLIKRQQSNMNKDNSVEAKTT